MVLAEVGTAKVARMRSGKRTANDRTTLLLNGCFFIVWVSFAGCFDFVTARTLT